MKRKTADQDIPWILKLRGGRDTSVEKDQKKYNRKRDKKEVERDIRNR